MPRTVAIGAQDFGRIIENNSAKREKAWKILHTQRSGKCWIKSMPHC